MGCRSDGCKRETGSGCTLCRVGVLRVCDEGLQALAAHCSSMSGELAANTTQPATGWPNQATSAAVAESHALIGILAVVLAERVDSTGARVSASGTSYMLQDRSSAGRISAVGSAIEV